MDLPGCVFLSGYGHAFFSFKGFLDCYLRYIYVFIYFMYNICCLQLVDLLDKPGKNLNPSLEPKEVMLEEAR